ncbi:hypothetical protein Q644_16600 [Brucella intermedia 229E]|uniref:Tyr recombinase domain-containing protein n=1 Tax=Brucella intermedia 229E TaxID=1337887 RepID=U4V8Z7_9HYPH|nr:hypothetical protein Q644_16600 [Brucella intermedia 229E]
MDQEARERIKERPVLIGGVTARPSSKLSDAIDKYVAESLKEIGRTKAQTLKAIKRFPIANKECGSIRSQDIVKFGQLLAEERTPQTVGNWMSHLAAIFTLARPAWGFPLDPEAMKDAQIVMKRLGVISKSNQRDRRPTIEELNKLLEHFTDRELRQRKHMPMCKMILFALFSTRRQGEICTMRWEDFEPENKRILIRDMKNPGEKMGNNVWCDLPEQAVAVLQSLPPQKKEGGVIFPYVPKTVSARFMRTCPLLDIEDLDFHDLRHEGISRLFEMGWNIPHVAMVSGHRSWTSLKRYTHIRQTGDKYENWKWINDLMPRQPISKGETPI